jgi:hypothetical protein
LDCIKKGWNGREEIEWRNTPSPLFDLVYVKKESSSQKSVSIGQREERKRKKRWKWGCSVIFTTDNFKGDQFTFFFSEEGITIGRAIQIFFFFISCKTRTLVSSSLLISSSVGQRIPFASRLQRLHEQFLSHPTRSHSLSHCPIVTLSGDLLEQRKSKQHPMDRS